MTTEDCAFAVLTTNPFDLVSNDIQSFVPTDLLVRRLSAIGAVTISFGIKINPLERIQQSILRVDNRLRSQCVRRDRRATRRRKCLASCGYGPRRCIFSIIKLNWRNTNNFPILYVHKNRATIGVVDVTPLSISSWRSMSPCYCLDHSHCFHEPQ